jgi:hypothetical protein
MSIKALQPTANSAAAELVSLCGSKKVPDTF